MAFEDILGKGEYAGNQQFLFYPQYFITYQREISLFVSANVFQFGHGLHYHCVVQL